MRLLNPFILSNYYPLLKKSNTPSGTVRLFLKQDVEAYAKKYKIDKKINQQRSHHIDCDGFLLVF